MYVVNREARILILGDGRRPENGKSPVSGTRLDPGQALSVEDVTDKDGRRQRFIECVRQQIAKGVKLEIMESAPAAKVSGEDIQAARAAKNLEELDRLTQPAPKAAKPRTRKTPPLGG